METLDTDDKVLLTVVADDESAAVAVESLEVSELVELSAEEVSFEVEAVPLDSDELLDDEVEFPSSLDPSAAELSVLLVLVSELVVVPSALVVEPSPEFDASSAFG